MTSQESKSSGVVANTVAGATQASLVTIVGYPFDTVKSRMQTHGYLSSFHCVRSTIQKEGVRALYRGGTMPWLSHLVKRPLQFPISEWMKREQVITNNYLIGGVTGPLGAVFGTPLQVVKVGMQTSNQELHKTSWSFIRQRYESLGLLSFYKGFVPTLMKDCLFGASFVGHYYTLRDLLGSDAWYKNFASGATAHCATWAALMPIDYVKTTIQRNATPLTIRQVVRSTVRERGPFAFWKGLGPACARTIPVSGIAMTGYEFVRSLFN